MHEFEKSSSVLPNRANFRPPTGHPSGHPSRDPQVKSPGGSAADQSLSDPYSGSPDVSCLSTELDGDFFSTAYAEEKGVGSKLLTSSKEGMVMSAAVSTVRRNSALTSRPRVTKLRERCISSTAKLAM